MPPTARRTRPRADFLFMDYSGAFDLSMKELHIDTDMENNVLYSGAFVATLPFMLVAGWALLRGYDWSACLAMSALIVLAGWLRWAAVVVGSYALAVVSTALVGVAGGVIFTMFTFLPARWFPEGERGLATSLAVQATYAGWALGALIPIVLGSGGDEHAQVVNDETFLLAQAIVASVLLPLHFVANRRGPLHAGAGGAAPTAAAAIAAATVTTTDGGDGDDGGVGKTLCLLATRPQYVVHSCCYAVLGGVGYAVGGAVDECFGGILTDDAVGVAHPTMWLTFVFIVAGVVAGLILGAAVPDRPRAQAAALRTLFAAAAASLVTISVLLALETPDADAPADAPAAPPPPPSAAPAVGGSGLTKPQLYAVLFALFVVAGVGTVGFIGIGLRVAVAISRPADETYAGGTVEFILLVVGTVLGIGTSFNTARFGFWWFSAPAAAAAVALFAGARFNDKGRRTVDDALLAAAVGGA